MKHEQNIDSSKSLQYEQDLLKHFYENYIQKDTEGSKKNIQTILDCFPLYGVLTAFKKFRTNEDLMPYEEKAVINFTDRFTTCTLNAEMIKIKNN